MTKLNLSENELAERWGVSPKTLQRWRNGKRGPSYLKCQTLEAGDILHGGHSCL